MATKDISIIPDIEVYTELHEMKINPKKTVVMSFNFSRKYAFIPQLTLQSKPLEVIHRTKLVRVIVTTDCKFKEHIKYLTAKAKTPLFFLRRLKLLGANTDTLVETYKLFIRSILEYAAPLWDGAISEQSNKLLESIEKISLKIILCQEYKTYEDSLTKVNLTTLKFRRSIITRKCAYNISINPKF